MLEESKNLNKEKEKFLKEIKENNNNIFITGNAGTGKTFFLQKITEAINNKNIAITAPTGIAALNIGGQTIHSFFGFPFNVDPNNLNNISNLHDKQRVLATLDILIIDEVSMVRADLFDAINIRLQNIKRNNEPFGGVRLILSGDLYQLPPVVTSEDKEEFDKKYDSPFFFSSKAYEIGNFKKINLLDNLRQKNDNDFLQILDEIRVGTITNDNLTKINNQVKNRIDRNIITFVPTNRIADSINTEELNKIASKEILYKAQMFGAFNSKSITPAPVDLRLKIGARVMLIKNIRYDLPNGLIGTVRKFDTNCVYIDFDNNKKIKIKKQIWKKEKYTSIKNGFKKESYGSFVQFPLKLTWANTIHKAQGLTLDKINIDWGNGTFAHGQAYVALSRCKSLDGISLLNKIQKSDIILDKAVLSFMNDSKKS